LEQQQSSKSIDKLYKSAACFCRQVAAWAEDIFCHLYLMKFYKITKNLTTTEAREKMARDLEPLKM
jgi:hypothetical protein